jgi:hypothetical protein
MGEAAGRAVPLRPGKFYRGLTEVLKEAVRRHTDLHTPQKDGSSLYHHLMQAQRRFKKPIAELEPAWVPWQGQKIWTWFWELDRTRPQNDRPLPFTYQEIEAWARLTGREPSVLEVICLTTMDQERLRKNG